MADIETTEDILNPKVTRAGYKRICKQEAIRDKIDPDYVLNGIIDTAGKLQTIDRELCDLRDNIQRGPITVNSDNPEGELITELLTKELAQRAKLIVQVNQARISGLTALTNVYFKQLAKLLPDVPMVTPETLEQLTQAEPQSVTSARQQLTEKANKILRPGSDDAIHSKPH